MENYDSTRYKFLVFKETSSLQSRVIYSLYLDNLNKNYLQNSRLTKQLAEIISACSTNGKKLGFRTNCSFRVYVKQRRGLICIRGSANKK